VKGYLEKSKDVAVVDAASVTGGAVVLLSDIGLRVRRGARFTMEENPTTLGGVPSRVQVAVLLQRNAEDEELLMSPTIDLRTGTWQYAMRKIRRFFGWLPESEATIRATWLSRDCAQKCWKSSTSTN